MIKEILNLLFLIPSLITETIRTWKLRWFGKSLENKVVLITGASSGIGKALAFELYSQKCKLILASRNVSALNTLRRDLTKSVKYENINFPVVFPLDLDDSESLKLRAEEAVSIFQHVDILVNNGGISHRSSVNDTDIETHRKIFEVNYFGTVALTKYILPFMMKKGGHIVNISSLQGLFSMPYRSAYSASKQALQGFTDSLRAELYNENIKVSVVSPGYIRTSIGNNALDGKGQKTGKMDSNTANGYSAEFAARKIRECIQLEEDEYLIAPYHHCLIRYIRTLAPWVYFRIVSFLASRTKPTASYGKSTI